MYNFDTKAIGKQMDTTNDEMPTPQGTGHSLKELSEDYRTQDTLALEDIFNSDSVDTVLDMDSADPAEFAPESSEQTQYFTDMVSALGDILDVGDGFSGVDMDTVDTRDMDMVIEEAVAYCLLFKQAELEHFLSTNSMQATGEADKIYRSLMTGSDTMSKAAISALLRSIISFDDSSIFSNLEEKNYKILIYGLLDGIIQRYREADTIDESTAVNYRTLYDKLRAEIEAAAVTGLSEEEITAGIQKAAKTSISLSSLIAHNPLIQSIFNAITAAIPKIENLKKFIVMDKSRTNKRVRAVEEHVKELEADVELLRQAVRPVESAEDLISRPIVTIFKSTTHPASNEDGVTGFKFVCGSCGKEHFTVKRPFYVNRLKPYVIDQNSSIKDNPPDYPSAMMTIFNPIQCPSCAAINIFTKKFVWLTKNFVLHLAKQGAFTSNSKGGTNELNLSLLSGSLQGLMGTDSTILKVGEVAVEDTTIQDNPLNGDIEPYIKDFVSRVRAQSTVQIIRTESTARYERYLKFLYKVKPIFSVGTDKYSMVYTILRRDPSVFTQLSETATALYKLKHEVVTLNAIVCAADQIGEFVSNDVRVSVEPVLALIQHYIKDFTDISDIYEDLRNKPVDYVKSTVSGLFEALLATAQAECQELSDKVEATVLTLAEMDIEPTTILRESLGDKAMDKLGITAKLASSWDKHYIRMLEETMVPLICSNPGSSVFLGGALTRVKNNLEKSLLTTYKEFVTRYNVNVPRPSGLELNSWVRAFLTMVSLIDSPVHFEAATKIPIKMLASTESSKLSQLKTAECYLSEEISQSFGVDPDISYFINGCDLNAAYQNAFAEEIAASDKDARSGDMVMSAMIESRHYFVTCFSFTSEPLLSYQRQRAQEALSEQAEPTIL